MADMQRTIRTSREGIERLQAGDYSAHRYCVGPEAAQYIIKNRYESAITAAERVIDSLITPEDMA